MPEKTIPIKLPPGIVKDWTDYSTEGRYSDGERTRFRQDLPEKLGGWNSDSDYQASGVPRNILVWRDLTEDNLIAIGTHSHLYVLQGGTLYDITPLRKTSTNVASPPFSVTNTSTTVVVTDAAHGAVNGDWVTISQAVAVGGITLDGNYQISSATTNTYEITHSSAATSTTTGGGAATDIEYAITTGFSSTSGGLGWGAGTWNQASTTWGTARTIGSGVSVEVTYWSLDNWGEDLIATVRGGGTYLWDASVGYSTSTRAATLTNAPSTAKFSAVAQEEQHVLAYGAHDGANDDPMLIAWTDQSTNTTWTSSSTNSAGSFKLTRGTRIVAQERTRTQTLVWTDTSLYGQTYTGLPYVFTFKLLAEDTSIMGQTSAIDVNGVTFWIGKDNFYIYNGQVSILNSPVRRYVFDNLNRDHETKCFVAVNKKFQEVWFFYPRLSAEEPSHYAAYCYGEPQKNIWHIGTMARSCWQDAEKFLDKPIAYDATGVYYTQEDGYDDDGSALNPSIETGALELTTAKGEGGNLVLVDKIIPDATAGGAMTVKLFTKRYPQDSTETSKGPYTITTSTGKVSVRSNGRQQRIRWGDSGVGYGWRIGTPRIRVIDMGER